MKPDEHDQYKPANHIEVNSWMRDHNWTWSTETDKWFNEYQMTSVDQKLAVVFYKMHQKDTQDLIINTKIELVEKLCKDYAEKNTDEATKRWLGNELGVLKRQKAKEKDE